MDDIKWNTRKQLYIISKQDFQINFDSQKTDRIAKETFF